MSELLQNESPGAHQMQVEEVHIGPAREDPRGL